MKVLLNYSRKLFNFFLLSSVFNAGSAFLIIAYLSHRLSAEDFVTVGVATSLVGFLGSLVGLQTRGYILLKASKRTRSRGEVSHIIASAFWAILSGAILYIGLKLFNTDVYFREPITSIVFLCVLFQWVYYLNLILLQSKGKEKQYFSVVLITCLANLLYVFCVDYFADLSWQDRVQGMTYGFLFSSVLTLALHRKSILSALQKALNFKKIRISIMKSIEYSLPLVPYSISLTSFLFFERFIVSKNLDSFSAATFLAMAQLVLFYGIVAESMFKKCQRSYYKTGEAKALYVASVIILAAGIVFIPLGGIIHWFVFPEHLGFEPAIFSIMILAAYLTFLIKMASLFFNYYQINSSLAKYTIVLNLLGLTSMNILSKDFGLWIIPSVGVVTNTLILFFLGLKIKRTVNVTKV